MLLKFAINERSFDDLASLKPRDQLFAIQCFLATWREQGIWITTDSLTDQDLFRATLHKAPQSLKKSVKNILLGKSAGRSHVVSRKAGDLTVCSTPTDVEFYKSDLDVYLIDAADSEAYGIEGNELSSGEEPPEKCIFKYFIKSMRLARVTEANKCRNVAIQEDTRRLYDEYFSDHVVCASEINIVDRYCLHNQFKKKGITPSGLENLLTWIFLDNSCAKVKIISNDHVGVSEEQIREWVKSLKPSDAPEVEIRMLPDKLFSIFQHGRYMRLSSKDILKLDKGTNVFEGKYTTRTDELSFFVDKNGDKSASEEELLKKSHNQAKTLSI